MVKLKIIEENHDQYDVDISELEELSKLLFNLLREEARIVILEMPDVGIFTLGIGLPYGCVQYSKDNDPPYLLALADRSVVAGASDEIDFDAGGTPTPILMAHCLPYDRVVEIVVYCFETKKLPQFIKWIEI